MSHDTARVLQAIAGARWLIEPQALEGIVQIAQRANDSPEAVMARLGRPLDNTREVQVRDGVAVVPVTGPIFRYANVFTDISGATSVEVLARDFQAAVDDPQVQGIVLEIDSPGGQADGVAEFAALVRAGAAVKPVTAYIGGTGASAAYWIAAAADEVVINPSALAGSVGVVLTADTRKREGRVEIVSTQSPRKRVDVTTESGRAQVQSLVDDLAAVFVSEVAAYRGLDQEEVLAWEGGLQVGAKAVAAGMADRLGTLESVIAGLAGATRSGGPTMSSSKNGPEITRELIASEHPAIAEAFRAEGAEQALAQAKDHPAIKTLIAAEALAAATAERERIQAVQAQNMPGHEALIAQLAFDGQTTGPEAAVQVLAAERAQRGRQLQTIAEDAPPAIPPLKTPQPGRGAPAADAPLEVRAKYEWDHEAAVRADFADVETYTAFKRAEESGRARILRKAQ